MNNAAMRKTVPPAVAERGNAQVAPRALAAIVGTLLVGGRLIPMTADHSLEVVSLHAAALARPLLEDFGILE